MLNVHLNNNFASFLIFEFISAVVCLCLHNFALKLGFSIDFELFYSCRDSMHILEFEKSDSNVTNKIINNDEKISMIWKRFWIIFFKIHMNKFQNSWNLKLWYNSVVLFDLLISQTKIARWQFNFKHQYLNHFQDCLIVNMLKLKMSEM